MSKDMSSAPLVCRWTGSDFTPLGRSAKEADAEFVIGQIYTLAEVQARSIASHRHYFASLNEAWSNLPEDQAARFETAEHLRKFALIKCGYADSRQLVCSSKAEARRIAAFIRPADVYSIVDVNGPIVTVYTAQSQSMKAMGKQRFGESKDAVLDYVASLIEVSPEKLRAHAGKAA